MQTALSISLSLTVSFSVDRTVLMQQLKADTGAIAWQKVDVGGAPSASLAAARQALHQIMI